MEVAFSELPPVPRPQRCANDVQWAAQTEGACQVLELRDAWNFCTRPTRPPHSPLPSGSVRSLTPKGHAHRSTHSLPSCPPCAQPPLPNPAAVHLLVPSAPVRPSICLHTFGGNLWASLRSLPNPSRPPSPSSLRNGEAAPRVSGRWGGGSSSGEETIGLLTSVVSFSSSFPPSLRFISGPKQGREQPHSLMP